MVQTSKFLWLYVDHGLHILFSNNAMPIILWFMYIIWKKYPLHGMHFSVNPAEKKNYNELSAIYHDMLGFVVAIVGSVFIWALFSAVRPYGMGLWNVFVYIVMIRAIYPLYIYHHSRKKFFSYKRFNYFVDVFCVLV